MFKRDKNYKYNNKSNTNQYNILGNININKYHINNFQIKESKQKDILNDINYNNNLNLNKNIENINNLRKEFEQITNKHKINKNKKNEENEENYLNDEMLQSLNSNLMNIISNISIKEINNPINKNYSPKKKIINKSSVNLLTDYNNDIINDKNNKNNLFNCVNQNISFSIINNKYYNKQNKIEDKKDKKLETVKFLYNYIKLFEDNLIKNIKNLVNLEIKNIENNIFNKEKDKINYLINENNSLKNYIIKLIIGIKEYYNNNVNNIKKLNKIISQLLTENKYLRKISLNENNNNNNITKINLEQSNKFNLLEKEINKKREKHINELEEEIKLLANDNFNFDLNYSNNNSKNSLNSFRRKKTIENLNNSSFS